jgi:capsular exopolysaccharide synthesis family protein
LYDLRVAATSDREESSALDLLHALRRRWLSILLTVIVVVGATVAYDLTQTASYGATAGMLLNPQYSLSATGIVQSDGSASVDIPTESALISSAQVKAVVIKQIGYAPPVTVAQDGLTNIIEISAASPDPVFAAKAANAYAQAYSQVRTAQQQASISSQTQQIESQITASNAQLAPLEAQLAATKSGDPSAASLTNEILSLQSQIGLNTQRLDQLQLLTALDGTAGTLVNPAVPSSHKLSPDPKRDVAIAVLAGLVLGIGIALIREFFDDHIRTKTDLERAVVGLPTLGVIPEVPDWRDQATPVLISVRRPWGPQAEAYRNLRTAIQFMGIEQPIRTLQFTSAVAGDGKSVTTANIAIAMASAGLRVAAVSCDLRRPRLHRFFGISNEIGLTSVLVGEASLADALVDFQGQGRILVLPSGPIPPNPSELLAGTRFAEVLAEVAEQADIILVDSPPVIPITDSSVLATRVDAVIVVAAAGSSTRRTIRYSVETLGQVNAPIVGFVLNRASGGDSYSYAYDYRYPNSVDARTIVAAKPTTRG